MNNIFKNIIKKVKHFLEYNKIINMVDCYMEFNYTLEEIGFIYNISGKEVYNIFNDKLKYFNNNAYAVVKHKMKSDIDIIRYYID